MDDALTRIAAALTSGTPAGASTPTANKPAMPPADTIQPFPTEPLTREDVAEQIYYSMQVPIITDDALMKMEADLPALVSYLASLKHAPLARAGLSEKVAATMRQGTTERSDADNRKMLELAKTGSRDAFGDQGERNIAMVGIAAMGVLVAAFSTGYTIGKDLAQ
jgi:hypothetical protein